jgi:hypothetical protein
LRKVHQYLAGVSLLDGDRTVVALELGDKLNPEAEEARLEGEDN